MNEQRIPSPDDEPIGALVRTLPDFEAICLKFGSEAPTQRLQREPTADFLYELAKTHGLVRTFGAAAIRHVLSEQFGKTFDAFEAVHALRVPPPHANARLVTARMDEVAIQPVEWLWPGRIAIGKVTVLAGNGGIGKSTMLFDMAARLSRGERWPASADRAPVRSSVILSSEDDAADTIKPRLTAAGADMKKIHVAEMVRNPNGEQRLFSLQADLDALERLVETIGDVGLLIVDPVTAYLGSADSHNNAEVRAVLGPLGAMAARARVAIICNTHFTKAGNRNANHKVIGSVAFVNHARSAFIVAAGRHDPDRRLFIPSKSNVGPLGTGLAFRIEPCTLDETGRRAGDIVATRIAWEPDPVTIGADAAVAAERRDDNSSKALAMAFLERELAGGPKPAREILSLARAAGHTESTVRRAGKALGIRPRKAADVFNGPWMWGLREKKDE